MRSVSTPSTGWQRSLLDEAHVRHVFGIDRVALVVGFQIDLKPFHLAAELVAPGRVVVGDRRAGVDPE